MKTKTSKKKYVATNLRSKESQILSELIDRVLERHSIKDIVACFLDKVDTDDLTDELLKDNNLKNDLLEALENEFSADKFIVKLETDNQRVQLTDFVCSYIYPYYNQQQSQLFA